MKIKTLKKIKYLFQLLGPIGMVILISSPTGVEVGQYGFFGMFIRIAIGLVTMLLSAVLVEIVEDEIRDVKFRKRGLRR